LAPFFRYEQYDTLAAVPKGFDNDGSYNRWIYQAGLTYKPIPNIAIKADYRNIHSAAGQQPDEFNLGVGFIY
jgi:outer membrane receptor protein involved in Fe transport